MKSKIIRNSILAIFILSNGCTGEAPREASKPSAKMTNQLSILPQETNFVLYANIEAMRNSQFSQEVGGDFGHKFREEWREERDFQEFVEATGLDPNKDIYEVWVSALGIHDDYGEEDRGGAILRGNFDRERIVDYVKTEKRREIREVSYRDYDIFIGEKENDEEFAFTFLSDEIILGGNEPWLRTVLDLSENGGQNLMDNPVMTEYINDIPRKEHLWGVLNINQLTNEWAERLRQHGSEFKGTESLENMKTFLFYTYFDQKADINLKGIFETEDEAVLFADMLKGFKAMAKMMVSDDREAIDMLNEIKITNREKAVSISGVIGKEFVEKVEQKRKSFSAGEFKLL
ncbi:hypothetical protein GWO43_04515 [candidate division KSB1 bacterium]|nr:hypothetical protein [candidate division KSB1 bacterium]NIR71153.1 hypothetical protein [candidate division KSB1 bacterium]NIS23283.1 hypothetical protein [candidate division KSB1 bacterium]NIT70161.1 hypothetical protein [candidate division KSB1 bacterium]NIU23813.1 hypothetical protein [candidate division KSB1 bacterium]